MQTHPELAISSLRGMEKELVEALYKSKHHVSQKDLALLVGKTSQSTVSRALAKLVQEGLVVKQGQTRDAKFSLAESLSYWLTPSSLRKPVEFEPTRIFNYTPNDPTSTWLTPRARQQIDLGVSFTPKELTGHYRKAIFERFLVDIAWGSSRLEGNTYSLLDTEVLLKYGQEADDKTRSEACMILNHKHAVDLLVESADREEAIDENLTSRMHACLMRGLIDNNALGTVHSRDLRISTTAYKPSSDCVLLKQQLGNLCWKAEQIADPYEASFFLLTGFSYLQFFEDGNKRIGRLMANLPLLRHGLPPLSFVGIDKKPYVQGLLEFYELGKTDLLSDAVSEAYQKTVPAYTLNVQGAELDGGKPMISMDASGVKEFRQHKQTADRSPESSSGYPTSKPKV